MYIHLGDTGPSSLCISGPKGLGIEAHVGIRGHDEMSSLRAFWYSIRAVEAINTRILLLINMTPSISLVTVDQLLSHVLDARLVCAIAEGRSFVAYISKI